MSTIDKLLIRGIRSFGPQEKDQAIITFNNPVTLIVGQNGAGKTTIIECLKFSTTGEFPPNSKGGAFVIDPKLIGEREVKAVIKLRFINVNGDQVVCHRILQSEQKIKKIEQKQLDGSLERKDKNTGEKVKITTRCAEINVEMIRNLGVSKAILNHVIFCHQEESNWPLSEGKALKTKFDEIFASTRYSKALDTIKKFQVEQRQLCNQYTAELKYLKDQKQKADELKTRLTETQKTIDALRAEMTRLTNELQPVDNKLRHLKSKFERVAEIEKQIATLNTSIKELEEQQKSLLRKIQKPFTGTLDELQTVHEEHNYQLQRSQRNLEECESKLQRICNEEGQLKAQINKLSEEYGRLESDEKHYQQALKSRDKKINQVASDLDIDGFKGAGPFSNESIRHFTSEVNEQMEKKKSQIDKIKIKFVEREKGLQASLTELQDSSSRLKQKKEMKEKQLQENEKHIITLNRQLARIATANRDFERLELELKQAEDELKEYQESVDVGELEKSLKDLQETKLKVTDSLRVLQQEMDVITRQSAARGALENMKKDKQAKEQDYQRDFGRIEAELLELLGYMPPDDNLDTSITDLEKSNRSTLTQIQSNVTKWSTDQSRLQAQVDEKESQIKSKKEKLRAIESEIESVCGRVSFEDKKKEIEEELSKKEENLSAIIGSQSFFKECLNKAKSSKKCPLCARGYDSQEGLNNLITSIERRLSSKVPELIKSYQQQMKQLQDVNQQLLQLAPQLTQAQILRSKEIPALEKEVNDKEVALNKLQQNVSEAEAKLSKHQHQMDQLRKLHPQSVRLSQLQHDLSQLDQNISIELSKLGNETVRSHAVVKRELQKAQMQSEELGRKMDNKRSEITTSQKSIRDLENRVHELKKQQLNLQKQVQERQTYNAKKEELVTNNQALKRDIEISGHQLKPIEEELDKKSQEKQKVTSEKEEKEQKFQVELNRLQNNIDNLQSMSKQIYAFEASHISSALEECKSRLTDFREKIDVKLTEKAECDDRREELRTALNNSKIRQRELEDNLELLNNKNKVNTNKRKIQDLRNKLQEEGLDRYNKEFQELQTRSERLTREVGLYKGRLLGKESEHKTLQKDLSSDMYSNAEKKHRDMSIKLKTTQVGIADLDKYYKALDRAIMQFHSIKMDEINKIIKELWLKTYKGGDIDTIEIRSDNDPEGTASTGRRVYNYRVVMVKGDAVLDMRGRCSAGQKVLASIIIRLALAESFCLHCGLLALDEPTTNLDRENVEGLAFSLSEIIRERQHQKNFQLIVITHDMEFVEMLGRSEFVDDYYLVKKDIGCCSTVSKIRIADIPDYN